MNRMSRVLALWACVFVLAACGGGPSGPVPTATSSTSGNPATAIPPGSCPRAALENWLARSNSLVTEFTNVVNTNLATPRDKVAPLLDQLTSLQGAVLGVSAPDCAADHRGLIEAMMAKVVGTFTDYSKGQAVDMPAFVLDFTSQVNKIKEKEAELNMIYKNLP